MKTTPRPKWSAPQAGFTLIELLIVVAIIGVLAAIAIPQFTAYRARGFNARVQMDMRSAATAQEAYFVANDAYFTGTCTGMTGFTGGDGVVCTTAAVGTNRFTATGNHPNDSYVTGCSWDSGGNPNLTCN